MTLQKQKQELLNSLYNPYKHCLHCPLGRTDNHNFIFGSGSSNAKLIIIGEAPGKNEEEQGLPFVGRSGKLLTQTLASLGINRDDIFITNIVKCRPQNNRTPTPKEVDAYKDLLFKQIEIIQPKAICTLGSVALQVLLEKPQKISSLRGTFFYYKNTPVMPTYHPAYILRNTEKLPDFIKDITKVVTFVKKISG
jgi:DNA polymerase